MRDKELQNAVIAGLHEFYQRRLNKLTELDLKETLLKKNPYLFKAKGMENAPEIVEHLLQAYMSSSEETIFGDAFFEPLVKAASSGTAAEGAGIDVIVETEEEYKVISVKSGPNWGNSSQVDKLQQNFERARRVFDNKKMRKHFKAILAHCYGRKNGLPTDKRMYHIQSGQQFWFELTGDKDFYLKILTAIGDFPEQHKTEYQTAWSNAVNRFVRDFTTHFCAADGSILWDKLLQFNSGEKQLPKSQND